MALLDFLKRKKEAEKSKQPEKKVEKVLDTKKTEKKPARAGGESIAPRKTTEKNFSHTVVKEPHISEKASYLAEKNQYTFKVYSNVNKPEIAKSIEGMYGVDVMAVHVIKIPKKKRRLGRVEGWRKGYRKAIVTIKEGQKIEVF